MEVSLPRTMSHIRVEGSLPSTPVLSVSKGSRSSNRKGKTPASGSKSKAKAPPTPKLILTRTSLEAEIPNISARELEEASASAEVPLVSHFITSFLFRFTEISRYSPSSCVRIASRTIIMTALSAVGTPSVTAVFLHAVLAAPFLCLRRTDLIRPPSWLRLAKMLLLVGHFRFPL